MKTIYQIITIGILALMLQSCLTEKPVIQLVEKYTKVDTVYKTITVDPNDPESMKAYEDQVQSLQQEGQVIIDTEVMEAGSDISNPTNE